MKVSTPELQRNETKLQRSMADIVASVENELVSQWV